MTSSETALPGRKLPFAWSHGRGQVWALGAALHHLEFRLPSGAVVRPLAEAPWHDEPGLTQDRTIPAHLRHLGGEWPCVPFGRSDADATAHGFGTDNCWTLLDEQPGRSTWEIVYPSDRPVERLRREIVGIHGHAAVELTLTVAMRRECTLPIGLHPILALPPRGAPVDVQGRWSHGETFPVTFEQRISRLAAGARFDSPGSLPLADGSIALADLATMATEEAFQLFGVDGELRVAYPEQGFATRLTWDARDFPTCLFWLSAGGRVARPWGGRFRGMGVEPLDARFVDRDGSGVITGGRRFRAGESWTTRYRIAVEPV